MVMFVTMLVFMLMVVAGFDIDASCVGDVEVDMVSQVGLCFGVGVFLTSVLMLTLVLLLFCK